MRVISAAPPKDVVDCNEVSLPSVSSRLNRPNALSHSSSSFPLHDPSPSSWHLWMLSNSFMSFSYHGAQKSHIGLNVRMHLQTDLSKGKRKESGKPHTTCCWQTLNICPHCKNINCKDPQPLSFHSSAYLEDELRDSMISFSPFRNWRGQLNFTKLHCSLRNYFEV